MQSGETLLRAEISVLDQSLVDCTSRVIPNNDETRSLISLEPVTVIKIERTECRFLASCSIALQLSSAEIGLNFAVH